MQPIRTTARRAPVMTAIPGGLSDAPKSTPTTSRRPCVTIMPIDAEEAVLWDAIVLQRNGTL